MRRHPCLTRSLPVDTYFWIEKRRPQNWYPIPFDPSSVPPPTSKCWCRANLSKISTVSEYTNWGASCFGGRDCDNVPHPRPNRWSCPQSDRSDFEHDSPPPPPRNIHRDRHHVKQIYLSCGGGLSKGKRSQLQTLPVRRPSTNGPVLGPDRLEVDSRGDPMAPPRYV